MNEPPHDGTPSEAEYLAAIEERFRRLRGRPLLLSPSDTRRALAWHGDGIPLDLALATIEELFDRAGEAGRRGPRSLGYCDDPVREAQQRRRELGIGAHGPGTVLPPRDPGAVLGLYADAAGRMRASTAPDGPCEEAARRLERLAEGDRAEGVADPLLDIEDRLVAGCIEALDGDARGEIETAARSAVEPWADRMSEEVLQRALRRAVARMVRERFDLPDLSRLPLPRVVPDAGGE